jgi:hypothetical protein
MAANKESETRITDILQVVNSVCDLPSKTKQDKREHIVCVLITPKSESDTEVEIEREKPRSESELKDRTSEEAYLAVMQANY